MNNITLDKTDYQYIRFAPTGDILVVVTYNGKMLRFVKESDGVHIGKVYRGKNAAVVSSISLRPI